MKYDLEDRTKLFSLAVISALKSIQQNKINHILINQLVKSATSVGANYREANAASSKKDFYNKISICRKEIQETKYWLELLSAFNPENKKVLSSWWGEAHELTLIFNKIATSIRSKKH